MDRGGQRIKTSVGRIIFNEVLPKELGFVNKVVDKSGLKQIVADCYKVLPNEETAEVLDSIKKSGFPLCHHVRHHHCRE